MAEHAQKEEADLVVLRAQHPLLVLQLDVLGHQLRQGAAQLLNLRVASWREA